MTTECNLFSFDFQPLGGREVVVRFDGGRITSDAGALLLRDTEQSTGILRQFAACFTDHREHIMAWCEGNHVDYVLGLAKNNRLLGEMVEELAAGGDSHRGCVRERFSPQRASPLAIL